MQLLYCVMLLVVSASAGRVRPEPHSDVTTPPPISPPPHDQLAYVARYLVHQLDWGMLATISARDSTVGDPFASSLSIADGLRGSGSGVPYFYQAPISMTTIDLMANPRMSLGITLAMTDFCTRMHYDQQSPLCSKVMLNGKWNIIMEDTDEENMAKEFLFSRHPEMEDWPANHDFHFAKMEMDSIRILDYFGGAQNIPIDEYLAANNFQEVVAKLYPEEVAKLDKV